MDFNSDGKVDEKDLAFLVNDWGISDWMSACDIGPFAWGDGLVDEKDLRVLMESLMTPGPRASGVPCDVVLSWISPSIAKSSDVYLGTSFEAVNTATRDDPCDVLVSWGQQETTYAPEAPLEFSRTYYWRVDTVLGASTTSICKGPVLSFATEPFAYAIQNITATASSSQAGTSPQKTVDGSGLDKNDAHSTNTQDVWQSTATPGPHWIQYEFDKVYALHELWVWNSNQLVEPILGFGARTVKIEYSVDGATWTMLDKVPEFARAPGEPACKPNTTVNFGGVLAKHVKLSIDANWGPVAQTGLAEVRFFYIPDRPWATMP
ncbi:MAG TPA: discoidin domain-containing protein [Sedimentisphaerales bacterium]|nr:discoidin domain-containing protein [Sedimentisphaerales bacterium]